MAMAIDSQHQQRQFGGMPFDHMPYANSPHFTNPWAAPGPAPIHSYPIVHAPHSSGMPPNLNTTETKPRGIAVPMPAYGSAPVAGPTSDTINSARIVAPPAPAPYGHPVTFPTSSPASATYSATSSYDPMSYGPSHIRYPQAEGPRRLSQSITAEAARSYGDAIDASRGMIAMSQNTTPRNNYGPAPRSARGSADSYGFPSTHSTSSSISSTSNYPTYFGAGSVDSSVSDYSGQSDLESVSSRTLPRPSGLLSGSLPPAPQSMMGQFSSKVSSSTQKKHKCKVCDKRFTRPSSLQTHMYSHTGEKPFSCEVEGCGRHFSVVSNLRRHRKVHTSKDGARSEAGSDDHDD